jgi:hypothetical protein
MQLVPILLQTIRRIKGMNAEGHNHCRERQEGNVSALRREQAFEETEQLLAEVGHRHLPKIP